MTQHRVDHRFARFCRSGDLAALSEVFDATAPELLRIASYLSTDASVAEDLLQDAFLVAIERCDDYDPARPVLPWLLGILANLARRRRRRRSRQRDLSDPDLLGTLAAVGGEDPFETAARQEIDAKVRAAIRGLPDPYRAVLDSHLLHGMSSQSIARLLECPASTVRNQLRRGLDLLRRGLPVGVGAGVAATVSASSLVGVRATVLARAEASLVVPATATGASLGSLLGVLMMSKKLAIASGLILLALITYVVSVSEGWSAGPVDSGAAAQTGSTAVAPDRVESAEAERRGQLESVVRTQVGAKGFGDVEVRVRWSHEDKPCANALVSLVKSLADPTVLARGETDAEGLVRFEGLAPGHFLAVATLDARRPVTVKPGEVQQIEMELIGYGQITGRVVDEAGRTVPGATIWLAGNWVGGHTRVGVSDALGRYAFRSVAVNAELYAEKPGHGRSIGHESLSFAGEQLDIELRLGSDATELRGQVVDEKGKAVVGAQVFARMTSPDPVCLYRYSGQVVRPKQRGRTDRDGRFRLGNILAGTVTCTVRAEGYPDARVQLIHPGEGLRMVLRRGVTVRGTVHDANGAGLAGATVVAKYGGSDARVSARSDARGEFVLRGVRPGQVSLRANHPSCCTVDTRLVVDSSEPATWDPVLPIGQALSGRVVDEAGAPLAGWYVGVGGVTNGGGSHETHTDADGRFSVSGLVDRPYRVRVQRVRRWSEPVRAIQSAVHPGEEIELVVRQATAATAELVGRVERPVGFERSRVILQVYDEGTGWSVNAAVGPDGQLRIGPLSPGSYIVHPHSFRTSLSGKSLGPFVLHAGETLDIGSIRLPTPTVVQLLPRLAGRQLPQVLSVNWQPHRERGRPVQWMWQGRFYDQPIQAGKYTVVIVGGVTHLTTSMEVEVLAGRKNEFAVDLLPGRTCEFRVKRQAGVNSSMNSFEIFDANGKRIRQGWMRDVWRIALPVGEYRVCGVKQDKPGGAKFVTPETAFSVGSLDGPPVQVELLPL